MYRMHYFTTSSSCAQVHIQPMTQHTYFSFHSSRVFPKKLLSHSTCLSTSIHTSRANFPKPGRENLHANPSAPGAKCQPVLTQLEKSLFNDKKLPLSGYYRHVHCHQHGGKESPEIVSQELTISPEMGLTPYDCGLLSSRAFADSFFRSIVRVLNFMGAPLRFVARPLTPNHCPGTSVSTVFSRDKIASASSNLSIQVIALSKQPFLDTFVQGCFTGDRIILTTMINSAKWYHCQ